MERAKIISIVILLTTIFVGGWLVLHSSENTEKEDLAANLLEPPQGISEAISQTATLIINYGSENPQSFELEIKEESTAFDLLKKADLAVSYSNSELGVFIESIGGRKNGNEGRYWLYYVNGEMAPVAADKQIIKPGDKVEFKFEKPNF